METDLIDKHMRVVCHFFVLAQPDALRPFVPRGAVKCSFSAENKA